MVRGCTPKCVSAAAALRHIVRTHVVRHPHFMTGWVILAVHWGVHPINNQQSHRKVIV